MNVPASSTAAANLLADHDQTGGLLGGWRRAYYGCETVPMTVADYDDEENEGRRVECWDSVTETAQVLCEGATLQHEVAATRLVQLVRSIAYARGSAIVSAGSTDIVWRNDEGQRFCLEADATIYLHPGRDLPADRYIEVASDPLPEVVLEVDHTTNVRHRRRRGRRSKLNDYAALGIPELWVEVPDASRTRGRRSPGLSILLLEGGEYQASPVSRAFPGWTAAEIHRALNEWDESAETVSVLRRVGRAMGAVEGTRPEDDPFLRQERREAAADLVRAAVAEAFVSRGIPISDALRQWLAGFDDSSDPAGVIRLAFTCRDADEFLRRVESGAEAAP